MFKLFKYFQSVCSTSCCQYGYSITRLRAIILCISLHCLSFVMNLTCPQVNEFNVCIFSIGLLIKAIFKKLSCVHWCKIKSAQPDNHVFNQLKTDPKEPVIPRCNMSEASSCTSLPPAPLAMTGGPSVSLWHYSNILYLLSDNVG